MADPLRLIPDTWFRAQTHNTTMMFLDSDSQSRLHPLAPGERRLGIFVLPTFQRPAVWTLEQKVRFIESCWMGLPIGVFVYNRTERDGPFDSWLLDGQQRITAIYEYMADGFPVLGYRFSELTEVDHRKWGFSTVFTSLVTNITSEEEARDVYERLAYGGTPHERT